jgi:hypothetical protein
MKFFWTFLTLALALFAITPTQAAECTAANFAGTYTGQTTVQQVGGNTEFEGVKVNRYAVFNYRFYFDGVNVVRANGLYSINGEDISTSAKTEYKVDSDCVAYFDFTNTIEDRKHSEVVTVSFRVSLRNINRRTGLAQGAVGRINVPQWEASVPFGMGRMLNNGTVEPAPAE